MQHFGLCFFAAILFTSISHSAELLPFSLPWDDSSDSITNVSHLLEKPAGKHGFIHIEDGHFIDGSGKRFRISGVNTAFSGDFPTHEQAEKVAARMAKFGINCVRFHHLDTSRAPNGIWKSGSRDKQQIDEENLDRMDYFIAQLKANGIYANINLKVGRKTVPSDGVPYADDLPTYDKGPDHFYPRLIELQKNYARDLLTHVNPYTGNRYAGEPSIAAIEINNESGLVYAWGNGRIDDLPTVYLDTLRGEWNAYLSKRYSGTEALYSAWQPQQSGSDDEILTRGLRGWTVQNTERGNSTRTFANNGPNDEQAMEIDVTALGEETWHVQTFYTGLKVDGEKHYQVNLWMKADRPNRTVSVGISMNHDPWSHLDTFAQVTLSQEWREYTFIFSPSQSDSQARLNVSGLASLRGSVWIANVSMKESSLAGLPDGASLENRNVPLLQRDTYYGNSRQLQEDWMAFLVERERAYYEDMHDYLRNELGVKQPIAGTQIGFAGYGSQTANDYIDIHGYWQHPRFPGQAWDSENWLINNISLINAENHVLQSIMMSRVEGYPYTVSEYNHPAPNTYASEVIPLTAAYGAMHDWDGYYFFAYSHSNDYENKSINNFFDIAGHTPKMAAMPAAANLFLRGDLSTAREAIVTPISKQEHLSQLIENGGIISRRFYTPEGYPSIIPFIHRTAVQFDGNGIIENPPAPKISRRMESDTGELVWDRKIPNQCYVLIRTKKTKGFVGFIGNRTFDLGHGVRLELGETMQNWANVLLTYMKTNEMGERWLLTATGYADNGGMQWKDDEKTSVGRNWGDGPPMVEAVPLRLVFGERDIQPSVFALDQRGQRKSEVPQTSSNESVVSLMDTQPSIWYEIVFETSSVKMPGNY